MRNHGYQKYSSAPSSSNLASIPQQKRPVGECNTSPPSTKSDSPRANRNAPKQIIELQKSQDTLRRQIGYGNLEYATHDSSHSKILLVGWYGAQNFGDDLMCRTIIEHLPDNLLSGTTVLVWDNKDLPTDYFGSKVRILHYPASTWDIEYLGSNFDTIIWGGGAILDDNQFTDNQRNINTGNLFIRLNKRVLERNGHVWCIGLSSNDHLADAEYIENLNFIVNRCDHFSLRDPYSLSVLRAAGIDTGNITLCEDIAFASSEKTIDE